MAMEQIPRSTERFSSWQINFVRSFGSYFVVLKERTHKIKLIKYSMRQYVQFAILDVGLTVNAGNGI